MYSTAITTGIASLVVFYLAKKSMHQTLPGKTNMFASFFYIGSAETMIVCGFSGLIYIIYTWIRKNDGSTQRGLEFENEKGTVIITVALLRILQTIFIFQEDLRNLLKACIIVLMFGGAWYTEKLRVRNSFPKL